MPPSQIRAVRPTVTCGAGPVQSWQTSHSVSRTPAKHGPATLRRDGTMGTLTRAILLRIGQAGGMRDERFWEIRRCLRPCSKSEATLRGLFENLPDFVDPGRSATPTSCLPTGASRQSSPQPLRGRWGLGMIAPEHQPTCRQALSEALATGQTQRCEVLDVFGQWWSCRVVPLPAGEWRAAGDDHLHGRHRAAPDGGGRSRRNAGCCAACWTCTSASGG